MRAAAATFALALVAVTVAGCAPSVPDSPVYVADDLPTVPSAASAKSLEDDQPVPAATVTVEPGAATPLSSIHRGPVQARIEAVRESDGAALEVGVDAPEALSADPLITVDCGAGAADGDFSVVVQDLTVEAGVATATVTVPRAVHGPGTYDGVVTFLDASGDAFRGAGSVVVLDGLESGRFDVSDPASGEHVTGTWECRAL